MAWIESHQALGHHPKTLALAAAFKCSVPTAVGYMHFLWWWALDYAPDGVVRPALHNQAARACQWHGAPDRFWSGLVEAGFVDERAADSVLLIHDWMDYAGRLIGKRAANAQRMRDARASNGAAHVQGLPTNQPTGHQPTNRTPTNPTPQPPSEPSEGGAPSPGATNGSSLELPPRPPRTTEPAPGPTCCPNFAATGFEHWQFCPNAAQEISA